MINKSIDLDRANPHLAGGVKSFYRIINDVGMTYGSIVELFRLWLINDMKYITNFRHTHITTQYTGLKDFYFTEAMLVQIEKPNLSLTYNIDHTFENPAFMNSTMRNFDAVHTLNSGQFMESIIKVDENKTNMDVKLSFRPVRINIGSGIVAQSRYHADNITQAWAYRRQDNHIYTTSFLIDFQIPDYIIDIIYTKFNVSKKTHRPMLKWLNRHCPYPVYYGMNTFNGKPYFFLKYKAKPLIRPNGLTNPQGVTETIASSEHWVLQRSFELDVVVPSMIAITGYENLNLPDLETFEQPDLETLLSNEYVAEYSLQIDDKHAMANFYFNLDKEDIIETKSGKKITKKMYVDDVLSGDGLLILFKKWGQDKGLTISELFDFIVSVNVMHGLPYARLGKGHTVNEALDKLNMTLSEYKGYIDKNKLLLESENGKLLTIDDLDIPNEELEYDHYIKNSNGFWFIDLDPREDREYTITVYSSIRLFNQFLMETGYTMEGYINDDDIANEYAQGNNKKLNQIQDKY